MANNRKSLQLYRNAEPCEDINKAKEIFNTKIESIDDGEAVAIRYFDGETVKTLLGVVSENNGTKYVTYFEELSKEEIIKNEKVVEKAFEKVQDVVGLDENFNISFDGDLADCTTIKDAINKLQTTINNLNSRFVQFDSI